MTPAESPKKRDYQKHSHYALSKALKTIGNQDGWVESLGDVGEALKAWKAAIIEDLGGEHEVSAMELSVIELATKTHLMLSSIDRFLLEQKSLINKSRRMLFPIVMQRQTLADALAGYMKTLGLKKKAKPPISLSDYLGNGKAKPSAVTPGGSGDGQGAEGQEV
ncbi:MAG: hypothetical protein ABL950_01460 [Nitrospira sp.]